LATELLDEVRSRLLEVASVNDRKFGIVSHKELSSAKKKERKKKHHVIQNMIK